MRHSRFIDYIVPYSISIHASIKDATSANKINLDGFVISIHASIKDATLPVECCRPEGGISIHASIKDATKTASFYA